MILRAFTNAATAGRNKEESVMKKFAENIADLIKVKTLATFAVVAVFVVLALRGSVTSDNVMIVVTTVIAFYFGTQHEKVSK